MTARRLRGDALGVVIGTMKSADDGREGGIVSTMAEGISPHFARKSETRESLRHHVKASSTPTLDDETTGQRIIRVADSSRRAFNFIASDKEAWHENLFTGLP